ncbi:MAG: CAP domain-containing protein [Gemmatimonadetes bacterium]|nr:CAP domain-containing protein [Gemmatimonadota bacterium]MDA1102303.1 CAP domain-containing protein [Gemmatimonadota bacterium]
MALVTVFFRAAAITGCGLILLACGDSGLGPDFDPAVEAFVELMNDHRVGVGCAALEWNGFVAEVAQDHSRDMVQRDFFAHENPDGASPFDRLTAAGIGYSRAAENIAWGYGSAASVLAGWLDSPGHRSNIENCSLTQHGVGLLETHWTHVFITP